MMTPMLSVVAGDLDSVLASVMKDVGVENRSPFYFDQCFLRFL